MIAIRRARSADVAAMSRVLIASITELCFADHKADPDIIADWTRNKAPDSVGQWVGEPTLLMLVAERDSEIAAVGCLTRPDEIGLNYVSPEHRFMGVSRALLKALEQRMRENGVSVGTLTSTETAHRFYLGAGWEDAGPPELGHNVPGYPMRKTL